MAKHQRVAHSSNVCGGFLCPVDGCTSSPYAIKRHLEEVHKYSDSGASETGELMSRLRIILTNKHDVSEVRKFVSSHALPMLVSVVMAYPEDTNTIGKQVGWCFFKY